MLQNMKNKQKEWHPATKPLKKRFNVFLNTFPGLWIGICKDPYPFVLLNADGYSTNPVPGFKNIALISKNCYSVNGDGNISRCLFRIIRYAVPVIYEIPSSARSKRNEKIEYLSFDTRNRYREATLKILCSSTVGAAILASRCRKVSILTLNVLCPDGLLLHRFLDTSLSSSYCLKYRIQVYNSHQSSSSPLEKKFLALFFKLFKVV